MVVGKHTARPLQLVDCCLLPSIVSIQDVLQARVLVPFLAWCCSSQ